MARIDKFDPVDGGFRAPLAADYTGSPNVVAVGINSSGQVVVGVGVAGIGIVGVICLPKDKKAGDAVDVMIDGQIVQFGGAAGSIYTANTTSGAVTTAAASATQTPIGWTLTANHLIVHVTRGAAA